MIGFSIVFYHTLTHTIPKGNREERFCSGEHFLKASSHVYWFLPEEE